MLVLTRKQNEKIQIGEDITITVVKLKGKAVRLGIQAPAHMSVLRGELAFEIAGEQVVDDESSVQKPVERIRRCAPSAADSAASWQRAESSPVTSEKTAAPAVCWSI